MKYRAPIQHSKYEDAVKIDKIKSDTDRLVVSSAKLFHHVQLPLYSGT